MSYFTGRISRYPLLPEESVAKRTRLREKLTSDDPVWELRDSPNLNADEFLGIPVTATTAEVRQAYRRLMGKCHPDRNATAQERAVYFSQKARDAVEILADDELRRQYDEFLKAYGRYNGGRGGMTFRDQFNFPSYPKTLRQQLPQMKSPPFVYRRCGARPPLGANSQVTKPQPVRSSRSYGLARPWQKYNQRTLQQQQHNKSNGNGHRDKTSYDKVATQRSI